MQCKLKKVTIYYEVYGEGHPILMLHGFEVDHRVLKGCMEPIFDHKPRYKRFYFDLPGMGKTAGESWIKNSDQMLDIVIEFIDKIIPNQTFIIVSESYGSYLARGVILRKYEFVEGVLFICPVIFARPNARNLPKHVILVKDPELLSNLTKFEAEDFENIAVIQNRRIWEKYRNEFFSGVEVSDKSFLESMWNMGYPYSFNVDIMIGKFDKPALFLMGRQDSIVGYRDAWKIIEQYPRASFVILDQAGHILQIEKEKLFNSLVGEWLDRIENIT
ncbi:MAG: alpha/beta fold hydrolase [Promethearchaeota archaeon]